jgi:acyl-CoA synthetase (AMP-forming)/AMP-acid ligase II
MTSQLKATDGLATVPAVLDRLVERFGDREGLVDGDRRLTFGELVAEVDDVAAALLATGIEPGDRLAIWAPNSGHWVIAALATYRVGAVLVPLNTRFKPAEARHVLATAGVRLVFAATDFLGTDYVELVEAAGPLDHLDEVVALPGRAAARATAWSDFLARAPEGRDRVAERSASVAPDDVSDIIFTSGTTGAPKGAMLTHGASVWAYTTWAGISGLCETDRYLIVNPFFHVFGSKAGVLACLLTGATILPHAVFDVDAVLQRVQDERVTMLPGPPTVHQTILDHARRAEYDLSSLRLTVTGAATIPVEMIRRMMAEMSWQVILTGYGLSETAGITTTNRPGEDPEIVATTAGSPMPGIELRIVDDGGRELGPGEPGEVLTRGPNTMVGYFRNAEATAEALDGDGWLHTGDIGFVGADGKLRITDRKKDMFIVGGFNAYPAEIEHVMSAHPSISQVAVVGVPDDRLGEVGMAFVVPRPGRDLDADEVITWCRERMANYKVPRRVRVVDAFPLNATGKVLKYELRAIAAQDRDG